MIKVDDLVEPRPEEIALSGLPTFFRPHESPRRRPQAARESRPARRINLPENLSTTAATRQIRLLRTARKLQPIRGLGVLHGRLIKLRAWHSSSEHPLSARVLARRGAAVPLAAPHQGKSVAARCGGISFFEDGGSSFIRSRRPKHQNGPPPK